jgi:hypothetical protein
MTAGFWALNGGALPSIGMGMVKFLKHTLSISGGGV